MPANGSTYPSGHSRAGSKTTARRRRCTCTLVVSLAVGANENADILAERRDQPIISMLLVIKVLVRKGGLEPPCLSAPPPQDGVSANSTTSALCKGLPCNNSATIFPERLHPLYWIPHRPLQDLCRLNLFGMFQVTQTEKQGLNRFHLRMHVAHRGLMVSCPATY